MARLRQASPPCDDHAEPSTTVDAAAPTSASSAFAGSAELLHPMASLLLQPPTDKANAAKTKTALVCKKSSPVKTAKKQIHLKPMNFTAVDDDLSILTTRQDWDDDRRQRPKRTVFSPIKGAVREISSGSSSMQSMISDSDGSSESSVPASLTSDSAPFMLDARIPLNLISDAKTQLFSPVKPKQVSILEFDTMLDALASTRLEDLMSDSEADDTFCAEQNSRPSTAVEEDRSDMQPLPFERSAWLSQPQPSTTQSPSTPPSSPSKNKLVSPSKTRQRIPTPPHNAASPNAFWSIEKVNQWNNHYSPQKIVRSPKKALFREPVQRLSDSPGASLRKQYSPSKPTQAELGIKRDFEARKQEIAETFLLELDTTITDNQVSKLAASTGGVQLIWSKTLNSTAGRANWKRTATRCKNADESTTEYKHYASIELAEKVINDETSLLNVLAHEFCHLANFMVLGIKDRPHGVEFKSWGRKCTQAFADRGVEVTTKHSFDIDYKYIWACTNDDCQAEFKRHSKSIDPSRHTCGVCRATLVQVKPVPRKNATGVKATGFAGFVKEHYAAVREELPAGASQKEIMSKLGEKYRATKGESDQACRQAQVASDLDGLVSKLGSIDLSHDREQGCDLSL